MGYSASFGQEPAGQPVAGAAQRNVDKQNSDPEFSSVKVPTGGDSYTVQYTGRLFGYFRYPEVQTVVPQEVCKVPAPGEIPAEMRKFEEALAPGNVPAAYGIKLRVATGDNFAPFLLSRQMWDAALRGLGEKESYSAFEHQWMLNKDIKKAHPDAYEKIQMGKPEPIPLDNVGCFLRLEQFDAIVPGQYDFYFGAARLQQLAAYLTSNLPNLQHTRMLGSNLYMQPREVVSAISQSAATTTPAATGPSVNKTDGTVEVALPKTVLPWMRSVRLQASHGHNLNEYTACIVLAAAGPANMAEEQKKKICDKPEFPLTHRVRNIWEIGAAGVLKPGTDYAVAVLHKSDSQLVDWQPFTVAQPFFPFDAENKETHPWFVKKDGAGKQVAVFGVVDPNLMQFIGRYEAVWLEERKKGNKLAVDDHFETDLQISDPGEALSQAVEYCQTVGECTPGTRMVLLAQMTEQTAFEMVSSFRSDHLNGLIDLVITQADPDRGTGNRTTIRQSRDGDRQEFADPVIVVPDPGAYIRPGLANRDQMFVRLQQAVVTPGDFAAGEPRVVRNRPFHPASNTAVTNDWFAGPASALTTGSKTLLEHLRGLTLPGGGSTIQNTELDKIRQGHSTSAATEEQWILGLQQIALKTMERYCGSDAAILQLRDVFWVPKFQSESLKLTDEGFEAVMDAIFWKGDFISCMNVPGSTLTSVLQRSQDLKQHQIYGQLSDMSLTRDWSLITLGANEEQKDPARRVISDRLLDSKKLYSVATTDFVANGDTGYPSLQGAEPLPLTPWSKTRQVPLSEAIANATIFKKKGDRAESVLDTLTSSSLPSSVLPKPNLTFINWLRGIFPPGPGIKLDTVPDCKDKPCLDRLQLAVQERPVWSFELYKADFSYSLSEHSGLERAVPLNFPGVSAVDLTAADSSSITFDLLFRAQRDTGPNEFYFQGEMNYGYSKRRQAASSMGFTASPTCSFYYPANQTTTPGCGDPYSRNQPADFAYGELGYARRLSKHTPYGWKFQLPAAVQTQLTPSVALPEGISGAQSTPSQTFPAPRSFYLEGRPGFRWEYSYPKPNNWNLTPGGGGAQSASGQQSAAGGGKGKGGASSSASQNGQTGQSNQNGQSGQGGQGGGQTQTFDSFIETGYEVGFSLYGPKAFVLTSSAYQFPATAPCFAAPSGTNTYTIQVADIVGCLDGPGGYNSVVNQILQGTTVCPVTLTFGQCKPPMVNLTNIQGGRNHFQDGLYLNYHFDTPVPAGNRYTVFSNIDIVSDLRSDFFFGAGGDSPIDTHFLVDAKEALNVPLFHLFGGKVSLAPTVELIWYSNKISNNLYKSITTSVSLSYTFEKRTGLGWWKSLGYQNPVPTLPTLPSR